MTIYIEETVREAIAKLACKIDGYKAALAKEMKWREDIEQKLNLARLGPTIGGSEGTQGNHRRPPDGQPL